MNNHFPIFAYVNREEIFVTQECLRSVAINILDVDRTRPVTTFV